MSTVELTEDNVKDDEPFGLGCAMELFSESNEVFEMIENIKKLPDAPQSNVERAYERFIYILGQYQEQPHLLDSHLDFILNKLIALVRDPENSLQVKHFTFQYMFVIVNVRGYKVIVQKLPHEVC